MKLIGLLCAFWLFGGFFGAGVANCFWAVRDGDGLGRAIFNTALILLCTVVLLVLVYIKQKPITK
jgi:hypothetical protein